MVDQVQNTPLQRNAALKINEVFRGKLDQELGYESLKDRRQLRKLYFSCILISNTTNKQANN